MSLKFRGQRLRCVGVADKECPRTEYVAGKNIRCPECKRAWQLLWRRKGIPPAEDTPVESVYRVYDLLSRELGNHAPLRAVIMTEGNNEG